MKLLLPLYHLFVTHGNYFLSISFDILIIANIIISLDFAVVCFGLAIPDFLSFSYSY